MQIEVGPAPGMPPQGATLSLPDMLVKAARLQAIQLKHAVSSVHSRPGTLLHLLSHILGFCFPCSWLLWWHWPCACDTHGSWCWALAWRPILTTSAPRLLSQEPIEPVRVTMALLKHIHKRPRLHCTVKWVMNATLYVLIASRCQLESLQPLLTQSCQVQV